MKRLDISVADKNNKDWAAVVSMPVREVLTTFLFNREADVNDVCACVGGDIFVLFALE